MILVKYELGPDVTLFGGNLIKAADGVLEAYSGRESAPGSAAL